MSPTVIWLIVGTVLCVMEVGLPTAFVELALGIAALLVAGLSLLIPQVGLQVAIWMVLSIVLTIAMRRLAPKRKSRLLEDAREARTLTEILPGQTGRVLYEGNSWQAFSEADQAIAPDQMVVVIGRRGTTLIISSVPQLEG
ncbi:MAG: NfeD family protein [Cyanobacteria bacterium J06638_20]